MLQNKLGIQNYQLCSIDWMIGCEYKTKFSPLDRQIETTSDLVRIIFYIKLIINESNGGK